MKIGYLRVSTEEQRPDRQIFGMTPLCDEHERKRLSERTKQGMDAPRRRDSRIGGPSKLSTEQIRIAQRKFHQGETSMAELAADHGVHPWTLQRRVKLLNAEGV